MSESAHSDESRKSDQRRAALRRAPREFVFVSEISHATGGSHSQARFPPFSLSLSLQQIDLSQEVVIYDVRRHAIDPLSFLMLRLQRAGP